MIGRMMRKTLVLALPGALALAAPLRHFDVSATFVPPKRPAGDGAVAVSFRSLDPDVRVNETPAPRLKLDLAQIVLVDRQPPARRQTPDYDPLTAKYLDLSRPVLFPVAVAPAAPKGAHTVKASVIYFYCSQREAWCRRGSVEIEVPVTVH
jgi:hypothetical protein